MNMNVLFICITIIICGILLAFCHYNEHKEDLSTDRFEYLVQQIEMLKKDHKILSQDFNAFEAASVDDSNAFGHELEIRDKEIQFIRGDICSIMEVCGMSDDPPDV